MSDICCLLDACTVINLIHIDEDDFILKKIDNLDVHINDTVFNEIKLNVYDRLNNKKFSKYSNKKHLEEKRKSIEQKLTFFRGKKNNNEEFLKDVGENYFKKIIEITSYSQKANGELCSTGHALYLSRFNEKKVNFYTDDYPAKEHFSFFFDYQQIGQIKDSVDLLILLYWIDKTFTEYQLDNILSELHSQYSTETTLLKQNLENFYNDKVDIHFLKRKKEIAKNLKFLIKKLNNFDFQNIGDIRDYFANKKAKCKEINDIIDKYSVVFELENNEKKEDLLTKIRNTKNKIKVNKIQKWENLLEN